MKVTLKIKTDKNLPMHDNLMKLSIIYHGFSGEKFLIFFGQYHKKRSLWQGTRKEYDAKDDCQSGGRA